ncbi:DUF4232 domain-containing protein [Patulibacter minatonensis]|uniref:DUF4232 domain-containing protein n=1 Tax=Patulibacter minatonensis TaxID=298163 RepID=UPI0004B5AC8D|nr:DUF4232 domain-containing protein [Patulibacter minatonensis]
MLSLRHTTRTAGTVLVLAAAGLATVPAADASASTARCHTSQLQARVGTPLHAAGTTYAPIVLRNASSSTCHVRGYPGIGLVGNGGDIVVNPFRNAALANAAKRTITLRPGGHASAVLSIAGCAGGGGAREGLRGLIVTPPGEYAHLRIRSSRLGWYCGGSTSVGVLVHGTRGVRF